MLLGNVLREAEWRIYSCPSRRGQKNHKREGSQSPVGRDRWEEALL